MSPGEETEFGTNRPEMKNEQQDSTCNLTAKESLLMRQKSVGKSLLLLFSHEEDPEPETLETPRMRLMSEGIHVKT
jgi:hypothetical protein